MSNEINNPTAEDFDPETLNKVQVGGADADNSITLMASWCEDDRVLQSNKVRILVDNVYRAWEITEDEYEKETV